MAPGIMEVWSPDNSHAGRECRGFHCKWSPAIPFMAFHLAFPPYLERGRLHLNMPHPIKAAKELQSQSQMLAVVAILALGLSLAAIFIAMGSGVNAASK